MANYKSTEVVGEAYTRCYNITLNNYKNQVPTMTFNEEVWYNIPGFEMGKVSGSFETRYDPVADIPLINPETGEDLGESVSQTQLQIILHSLYISEAKKRDERLAAALAAPQQVVTPPETTPPEATPAETPPETTLPEETVAPE